MQNTKINHKEPLFQISKRDDMPVLKSYLVRLVSIVLALLACALIINVVTKLNPVDVYKAMFEGSFGTERKLWTMLKDLAILLLISLAVTPAFKMKFWNIGAEGQGLVGALSASACMIYLSPSLNGASLIIVMLVSAVVAGIIWGIVPAFFKAKFDTNETLFTLMMNYIAIQLTSFFVVLWENPKDSNLVGIINGKTMQGWLPTVGSQRYMLPVLIVAVITIVMYIYLKYTKQGYEISVVGESQNTARYVGINVKKVIIRTMAISGALSGVVGFLLVSGVDHTISVNTIGGIGFTAIMVSWLAKFNPIIMVATSFLIVFLDRGSGQIATSFMLNESFSDICTGIILFFIIGCEFFVNYKITWHKKTKGVK